MTREEVLKAYDDTAKYFWAVVSGYNFVAYEEAAKAIDIIEQRGQLTGEALKWARLLEKAWRRYYLTSKEILNRGKDIYGAPKRKAFNLWNDLQNRLYEDVEMDCKRLFFAMQHQLQKQKVEAADMFAQAVLALRLCDDAVTGFDEYFEKVKEEMKMDFRRGFVFGRLDGMARCMRNIVEDLVKRERRNSPDVTIDFNDYDECRLGAEIIANHVFSTARINKAAEWAMEQNGYNEKQK